MATTKVQIDTKQIIFKTDAPSPLLAPDSEDSGYDWSPWRWDRRIWGDTNYENYRTILPVLHDAETWGIPDDYWQSGVGKANGTDLRVEKARSVRQDSIDKWSFEVKPGNFFRFHDRRYLFADRSVIQQVDNSDNESGRNVLQLTQTPRLGSPIWATMWTRNNVNKIDLFRFIHKKVDFTGVYSSDGIQQATRGRLNEVVWDKVDTTRKEFVVDNTVAPPKIYFNQDFTFLVGKASIARDEDLEFCEYLGEGNGISTQVFRTKYFPIVDNAEVELYVNTWNTTKIRDTDYKLDLDRGEITFFEPTPSEPVTWKPAVGDVLYLRYRPTLEVEYEPEDCKQEVVSTEIDVNPLRAGVGSGFIFVSQADLEVASVELTANVELFYRTRPTGMPTSGERLAGSVSLSSGIDDYERRDLIDYGLRGPVFAGTDYGILTATAYNSDGMPIPNVSITFDISGVGFLEGLKTFSKVTDANGRATVVYSPCRSAEDLGQYSSQPTLDNTLILTDTEAVSIPSFSGANIWTFSVYDTDSWLPWDPITGGGKKVLVSTGITANDPLRPTSLTGDELTYPMTLPITVDSGGLVAYWIAANKIDTVKAEAFSRTLNRPVVSNTLRLRIELPPHLQGVFTLGASGLGGATYFTE